MGLNGKESENYQQNVMRYCGVQDFLYNGMH